MAPTKPATAGRPRKSDAAATDSAAENPSGTPKAARGRGRPASGKAGVKKAYVPTGKPRGRPKDPNTVPKAPYVPTGKPRGRPAGSGKKQKGAARAAVARAAIGKKKADA